MTKRLYAAILTATFAVPVMIYGFGTFAAESHGGHSTQHKIDNSAAIIKCDPKLDITKAAESKPGGALYNGPSVVHHGQHGSQIPQMKGAHMDHSPRQGGAFFMAPDKIHHVEGVYSRRCGLQMFFYNAFIQPVRADRFKVFVRVIPQKEDEPEVLRFLASSKDGSILRARIGDDVTPPFDIEAFVKFPQTDEPQLFTIKVTQRSVERHREQGRRPE